ncbi:ABC transporter ATP-binding protein [Haloarcula onubensis]|uniref:ABC transporter ATP-binding protein n=1 Tax=Haloarcula onubensis TaxID=2950539 RepID=A0ABU2FJ61_9EURY|nr:ABC transporter ATP-binding protein [Halomicroarcula sp. S3CR25-11]MDS0280795.1 ABC transporter ATP-binding protein [Halomicroarcula sp. S3CR25-11]
MSRTDGATTAGAAVDAIVAGETLVREYSRGGGGGFFGSADAPTVRAIDGVSVAIERNEVVGIAGPSGSGKSTLLHLLAGLDVPTSGRLTIDGTDISTLSTRQRAKLRLETVGIVFQRFHLLDALSARANVAVPLLEAGHGKGARRERAEDLLEAVGLGDRVTHKPGQLSGGEQQRVAIARALATDPALVVADEPTGELDSEAGERVLDLLGTAADDRAVILASHDQQALDVCDRVVRLRDGQVVGRQ